MAERHGGVNMKRNKILSLLILFAVVVCCTTLFFACNTGAQDNEQSLRIFYDWGDGSHPIEKVVKASEVQSTTSALTPPTRDGYKFLGWSLAKDGDLIVFDQNTIINDGVTLYALWQYTKMSLYYDFNDGSAVVKKVIDKSNVKGASEEMTPANREGYDFVGWALQEKGNVIDFDNAPSISDGATLYAQWQIKTYSVLFMADDFTTIDRQTIEHGGKAEAPSLDKITPYIPQGQSFVGWQLKSGDTFDLDNPITARTVVYAIFSDVSYTVKFQNGDVVVKESTGTVGTEIIAPQATEQPKKDGYAFSHWESEDGRKFASGDVYAKNEIYYAIFTLDAPSTPSLSGPESNEIVYGESATVSAQIKNPSENITYSFVWYMGEKELGKDSSVTLQKLGVGEYTVRCEATASDGTLTSAKSSQIYTFNVKKATLTATIENINLIYGDKLPEIKLTYDGFKYGEDASVVKGGSVSTKYTARATVGGKYSVTMQNLTADNYNIVGTVGADKSISASINVAKRDINFRPSVFRDNSTTYDGEKFAKTYSNSDFDGLLYGHNITFKVSTTSANAKRYTGGDLTTSLEITDENRADVSNNYSFNITSGDISLTIDKGTIKYETSGYDATYNGEPQSPTDSLTVDKNSILGTYSIFYTTEESDWQTTTNTAVPSFKNAGNYTLYFRIDAGQNYEVASGCIEVTIDKARVKITPKPQYTTYGDAFELDQTEYILGECEEAVKKLAKDKLKIRLTADYKVGNNATEYTISVSTDENNNFEVDTKEVNTLYVKQRTISVTMKPASVTYGEYPDNAAQYIDSVVGLYAGDKLTDVINAEVDDNCYKQGDVVGTYEDAITCRCINANYTLKSVPKAAITVVKKHVDITFEIFQNPVNYGYKADLKFSSYILDTSDQFVKHTDYDDYDRYLEDVQFASTTYEGEKSNVGRYTVNVSIKKDSYTDKNYDITFTNGNKLEIVVNQRAVSLILNEATVTYGEPLGENALTYTVASNDDFIEGDDLDITYSHEYEPGVWDSVEWTLIVGNTNYDVKCDTAQINISQRTTTITYSNANIAQKNNGIITVDITNALVSNGYSGDTFGGTITIATSKVGTYTQNDKAIITANAKASRDGVDISTRYDFVYDIDVTVKQIDIDHNIDNEKTTYNGEPQSPTLTLTGADKDSVTVVYHYKGDDHNTMPSFTDAGKYEISYTLTQEGKTPYTGTIDFTINPCSASITAIAQSAVYGEAFTFDTSAYTTSGILDKDLASLSIAISTEYTVGNDAGSYAIVVSYTANDNYAITANDGTLTVSAKEVTVSISDIGYTTVYGEQATPFTSFAIDDENAREFITVKPQGYTVGGWGEFYTEATSSSKNYTVKDCKVTMSTIARPVTITANDASMTYGDKLPTFGYTITSGSLVGEDTLNVTYASIDSLNVGRRDIIPSATPDEKYTITAQNGTLTITKASLKATLSGKQTITYGDPMPTYTVSYTGFVNGEGESVLGGTLVIACDYMTAKKVGTFTVKASGLSADNYDITYVDSTLAVNEATLIITANAHDAITYGDALPTDFTYTATGFVNGDTSDILTGKVSFTCNYKQGSNAGGNYSFNVKCDKLANYTVTIGTAQTLVVNKANYTEAQVNEALSKLNLSGTYSPTATLDNDNSLIGTGFTWVDGNTTPTCDVTTYMANYCPDTTNYNVYENVSINLALAKADPTISRNDNVSGFVIGTDYTGEAINYVSIINGVLTHNNKDNEGLAFTADSLSVKDGGIYHFVCYLEETTNYNGASKDITFNVNYVDYNGALYTLEDALKAATSGTLTVKGNGFVSQNVTIPSGVTLNLPGHADDTDNATKPTYGSGVGTYVDNNASYILYKLTINNGITVTVNGTIIIRGLLGAYQGGNQGHTSGTHSQIINNGEMNLNNGATMAVRGYIKGNGHATYNSGATVYMPFVINDFRGGTSTRAVYQKGGISPFNVYELPNVQCDQTIMSGATVIGYLDLYASSNHNTDQKVFIGTDGIIETDGMIEKSYNAPNQKTTLTIVGNAKINALKLTVMGVTVSMSDVSFPISWKYDIFVGNGNTTTLSTKYDYKVLPGANVTVNPNATLALTGTAIVYDYFKDVYIDGFGYPSKSAANFVVNGTLDLSGASAFGGNIQATQGGAKVIVGSKTTLSITSKEGNKGSTSQLEALIGFNMKFTTVYTITETARFGEGTYTESIDSNGYVTRSYSGGTALETGKTYTYNGSSWA